MPRSKHNLIMVGTLSGLAYVLIREITKCHLIPNSASCINSWLLFTIDLKLWGMMTGSDQKLAAGDTISEAHRSTA
jgi:hypothetical protein